MENLRTSTREYINQAHHLMQNIYPAFLLDLQYLVSKDRGSNYKQGLDEAIGWMRRQLLPLNCEIELFDDGVHGKNLVARMKGTGKGKWVIFGHMDTVWEQGTTKEWHYETQDNIATGPGVVDNTGGTLAGLYTLKILHELGFDRFEEIIFINNSDEEIESPSSKPVLLRWPKELIMPFAWKVHPLLMKSLANVQVQPIFILKFMEKARIRGISRRRH